MFQVSFTLQSIKFISFHFQEKDIQRTQAIVKESLRIQAEQKLIEEQQKILQQQPFVRNPEVCTVIISFKKMINACIF